MYVDKKGTLWTFARNVGITSYSHVGGQGTMLVELIWVDFKQRQVLNKYVEHKRSRIQLVYIYDMICL